MVLRIAGDPKRLIRARGLRTLVQGIQLVSCALFSETREGEFFERAVPVVDWLLDIRSRVRCFGTGYLRDLGPVVFACNHVGIFDPVYVIQQIYLATEGRKRCGQIMRDDFFKSGWINRRMARNCNTIPFPRGALRRSNLESVMARTRARLPLGVVLFVSGTRSRTGEIMYRFRKKRQGETQKVDAKPPGRFLEFLLSGLRVPVEVVPTTVTYDFASGSVHIVFGPPVPFRGDEAAPELRHGVEKVVHAIENQVVVGPQHLLPCVIHHPGMEGMEKGLPLSSVKALLQRVADRLYEGYGHVQDGLREDFAGSFDRVLQWYKARGAVRVQGEDLHPAKSVRSSGEVSGFLRNARPSLFYWNQVKHLAALREAIRESMREMGWTEKEKG